MAFKNMKKAPKAQKKPPIPRRVPIAKGETTPAPDSPARSKLLKAAQGEIAGRIERLEREERGEATPAGTAATIGHDETDGPAPTDGAPSADAAHGGTSPATGKLDHEVPSAKERENDANIEAFAKSKRDKADKAPRAPKPAKEPKPKRVSALDAAATVLRDEAKPMRAVDLITQMEAKGLWKSPGGQTPASTLYAAMVREINTKGDASRFRKSDKGMFAAAPHAPLTPARKGE